MFHATAKFRRVSATLAVILLAGIIAFLAAPASATSNVEQQFLNKINQERTSRGLNALVMHCGLVGSARNHSVDMRNAGYLYHTRDLAAVATGWEALGENVGVGPSVDSLHDTFMNSPSHRQNVLGNYTTAGIGVVEDDNGQLWVTIIFMRGEIPVHPTVKRSAGINRYETAATIAMDFFEPDHTSTVFITTGNDYPDALTAGPAAGRLHAPILFATRTSLPEETRVAITRLHPTKIVVVGGTAAVSATVFDQLKNYAPTVTRCAGRNRYATSAAVSSCIFPAPTQTVYIATGTNYPDALAAGPAAIKHNGPVLLTTPTSLPPSIETELRRLRPSRIVVVGGTAAVSATVFDQLKNYAPTVIRRAGTTRWGTARSIANYAYGDQDPHTIYIATGYGWADSVAGTPAAAQLPGPLLLVGTSIPPDTQAELNRLHPKQIVIFGGTAVVDAALETRLSHCPN